MLRVILARLERRRLARSILTSDWVKLNGYEMVEVGRGTYGHPVIIGAGRARLSIGSFCSIASGVKIILANHRIDSVSTYPFSVVDYRTGRSLISAGDHDPHAAPKGPVVIGNDCWIGENVIILPGVSVGDGAVVGAGAVVSRDVPRFAVAVGNPAKVVKMRFDPEVIGKIDESDWWHWEDERLALVANSRLSVAEFFDKFKNRGA